MAEAAGAQVSCANLEIELQIHTAGIKRILQIPNSRRLDIYHCTQHASVRDFNLHALNEFRKIVRLDSTAVVDLSMTPESPISITGIHLHDALKEKLVERPKIFGSEKLNANGRLSSGDFVLSKALSQRNGPRDIGWLSGLRITADAMPAAARMAIMDAATSAKRSD